MSAAPTGNQQRSQRRRSAVDAYVTKLREQLERLDRPGEPAVIEVADGTLLVEPWVVARIVDDGDAARTPDAPAGLAEQAVALEMKIVTDRRDLQEGQQCGGQKLYAAQAELMLDAAIGMALSRELQAIVDDEVRAGRLDDAKSWTRFRNAFHNCVAGAKELLADSERTRVESISDSLTDRPRAESSTAGGYDTLMRDLADEEATRKRRLRLQRRARNALAALPSRTEILVALLAIAAVFWLGFLQLPKQFASTLPVLTAEHFPRTGAFIEVIARPPSLYVKLDGKMWADLDREERGRLVRTVSSVLLTSGYSGALLSTEDGRPVAQWLAQNGVQLLEKNEVRVSATEVSR